MRLHRFLPVLALLAFSFATAAPTGHLAAASVEATGTSTTTADLGGLFVLFATNPAFTLDADRLTIENHHANATLAVQTPLVSRYNVAGDPDTLHDGPGLLAGHANRPTEALWVLPLNGSTPPTLTASAVDCVTLEPPEKDAVTARAIVNTVEPEWSIDTSHAASWRSCQDATATIRGDFLFVLWEWDVVLTSNGETRTLYTGHQDAYPGTPIDGTVGTADELFITVRNGSLTLPLAPRAHELYLHEPRVEAQAWRFTDAAGALPAVGDVAGTIWLTGSLAATVTGNGAGHPLGADVEGVPERVEVNGQTVAVTVPAVPGPSRISVAFAVGVVAAVVAALAWRWRRVRRSCESAPDVPVAEQAGAPPVVSSGAPECVRDVVAERRVLRVVETSPGVTVRELQQRARVSKTRAAAALDALLARGVVVRCGSPARWLLFPPWPDLEERWRREDALRNGNLRLLLGVLLETKGGMEQSRVVAECWRRFQWAPSTTKDRLRRLAAVGLAMATESVPSAEKRPPGTLSVTWAAA